MSTHSVNIWNCTKTKTKCIKSRFHTNENSIIHMRIIVELFFLEYNWIHKIRSNLHVSNVTKFRKIWLASTIHIAWMCKSLAEIKFTRAPSQKSRRTPDCPVQKGTLELENYPEQVRNYSIINTCEWAPMALQKMFPKARPMAWKTTETVSNILEVWQQFESHVMRWLISCCTWQAL